MMLQTARELIGKAGLVGAEGSLERRTAKPSRITCRWEQDPRTGQLFCVWMLEQKKQ